MKTGINRKRNSTNIRELLSSIFEKRLFVPFLKKSCKIFLDFISEYD